MSTRTTTTGTSGTPAFRFSSGQPDGLNEPATAGPLGVHGALTGRPPVVWMTGGGTLANADPATIGMDRILDYLCDVGGYTIGQPNVPWLLGNATAMSRIDACAAWLRTWRGATSAPPILLGVSNGWVCAIIYARQFAITGIAGILPVTAGKDGYNSAELQASYDIRGHIQDAWGVTYPTLPPARFSPYDDIANYPDLDGKGWAAYSACDPLLVPQQVSFLVRKRFKITNLGSTGHLGPLSDSSAPVDQVDEVDLLAHIDSLW